MKWDKSLLKATALAMSYPGAILFSAIILNKLVKMEILSKNSGIIILLGIIFSILISIVISVLYKRKSKKIIK